MVGRAQAHRAPVLRALGLLLVAHRPRAQPDLAALCDANPSSVRLRQGAYLDGNSTVSFWRAPAGAACRWSASGDATSIATL